MWRRTPPSPAEDRRTRWSGTRQPFATPRPKTDAQLTEPAPAQQKLFKRAKPAGARAKEDERLPPSGLDKNLTWMSPDSLSCTALSSAPSRRFIPAHAPSLNGPLIGPKWS